MPASASTPRTAPVMGGYQWGLLLILAVLWGSSFFFFKVLVEALPLGLGLASIDGRLHRRIFRRRARAS